MSAAAGFPGAGLEQARAAASGAVARAAGTPAPASSRADFLDLEVLGRGSVGTVTRVRHRMSGGIYALKAISKQTVLEHNLRDQLLREVQTQLAVSHPNLLKCFNYFEEDGHVFLVLEFACGGDLYRHLKRAGPMSEPNAAHVFAQVAEGLQHLHAQGIIHRDMKPENVLLTGDLCVKIADFGWCAKAQKVEGRTTFCGTLSMLAPEMIAGRPYDEGVDIWAIGVLLFEMLAGTSPFDRGGGIMETCENIMVQGLEGAPLEKVPAAVHPLLHGLLDQQASRRWPLPRALADSWVTGQRTARTSSGPGVHALASPVAELPRAVPSEGGGGVQAAFADWDLPPTAELLVEPLPRRPAAAAPPPPAPAEDAAAPAPRSRLPTDADSARSSEGERTPCGPGPAGAAGRAARPCAPGLPVAAAPPPTPEPRAAPASRVQERLHRLELAPEDTPRPGLGRDATAPEQRSTGQPSQPDDGATAGAAPTQAKTPVEAPPGARCLQFVAGRPPAAVHPNHEPQAGSFAGLSGWHGFRDCSAQAAFLQRTLTVPSQGRPQESAANRPAAKQPTATPPEHTLLGNSGLVETGRREGPIEGEGSQGEARQWLGTALKWVGIDDLWAGGAAVASPALVSQLLGLGFTSEQALAAARRTSTVEAAVEWILANPG